jgi:hypothetical protein
MPASGDQKRNLSPPGGFPAGFPAGFNPSLYNKIREILYKRGNLPEEYGGGIYFYLNLETCLCGGLPSYTKTRRVFPAGFRSKHLFTILFTSKEPVGNPPKPAGRGQVFRRVSAKNPLGLTIRKKRHTKKQCRVRHPPSANSQSES